MAPQRRPLLPYLCRLVGARASNETDQDLLQRFVEHRDSGAFEMLMQRHSALVRGDCMRALRNTHDADDAFQATFLVLVRSARSIRRLTSVGPWLHGVARRIAHKMRTNAFRRHDHEQQAAERLPCQHMDDLTLGELKRILDEEIANLPRNFREPLILCCLEGKSRDEAAHELGWTVGAVKGRLERGREALRFRLAQRGLTLGAAFFTLTLAHNTALASASLMVQTVNIASKMLEGQSLNGLVSMQTSQLVQATLHSMLMAKLKAAALTVGVMLCLAWAMIGLCRYGLWPTCAATQHQNGVSASKTADRIVPEMTNTLKASLKITDSPRNKLTPTGNISIDPVPNPALTSKESQANAEYTEERQECMRYLVSKK